MNKVILLFFLLSLSFQLLSQDKKNPQSPGAHDKGPDKVTQKKFTDLQVEAPYNAKLSEEIMRGSWRETKDGLAYQLKQKFRVADGDIAHRGLLEKNSIKILFIGQDGTHFAVGGNYPGISGFGGRAQDMAMHFGISYSLASMNTFSTTIKGQYSANEAPFILDDKIEKGNITPNDMWMLAQDQLSPLQIARSRQLEWFIRNNPDSLKLIVTFGGGARDSLGSFIEKNGGKVGARFENILGRVKVPEFYLQRAGGNNEFPTPYTKKGMDLYSKLLGEELDYSKVSHREKVFKYLEQNPQKAIDAMVFSDAGYKGSGLIHPAQLGGYDLDKISINKGEYSRSLKGMVLSEDGYVIKSDILVASWKHPTFLSYAERDARNEYIRDELLKTDQGKKLLEELGGKIKNIEKFVTDGLGSLGPGQSDKILENGIQAGKDAVNAHQKSEMDILEKFKSQDRFYIEPDMQADGSLYENAFHLGYKYSYGKSGLPLAQFMAGMSNVKIGTSANATRGRYRVTVNGKSVSAGANIVVMGDRAIPGTDKKVMDALLLAKPNEVPNERYMLRKATSKSGRYIYDNSIPEHIYEIMKTYDFSELYKEKNEMSFKENGIKAFNIKSHPDHKDFGQFRGKFDNPKVIILADPDGWDEFTTNRAMTGTRGQYLQGMMNDIGIGDDYLVLRTVPFQMDGASSEEWDQVIKTTKGYREKVLEAVMANIDEPVLFLSDGPQAQVELERILTAKQKNKLVSISRRGGGKYRANNGSGIEKAVMEISDRFTEFKNVKARVEMKNIPRTHLPYLAAMWWGTSGDTSLNATGKMKGLVVQTVRPLWVTDAIVKVTAKQKTAISKIKKYLKKNWFPLPNESIPQFLKRKASFKGVKCDNLFNPDE